MRRRKVTCTNAGVCKISQHSKTVDVAQKSNIKREKAGKKVTGNKKKPKKSLKWTPAKNKSGPRKRKNGGGLQKNK